MECGCSTVYAVPAVYAADACNAAVGDEGGEEEGEEGGVEESDVGDGQGWGGDVGWWVVGGMGLLVGLGEWLWLERA